MGFSDTQGKIIAGAVALLVIVVGVVLFRRSAPAPTIPAGQTLDNPMGNAQPAKIPATQ